MTASRQVMSNVHTVYVLRQLYSVLVHIHSNLSFYFILCMGLLMLKHMIVYLNCFVDIQFTCTTLLV